MTFLVWRLHRNQLLWAAAALAGLTVVLVVTGVHMIDDYHRALADCTATNSCGDLSSQLFRGDGAIFDVVNFTAVVPLLFGLFWGAPLVAKEVDDGTHNLAWTQGVSRRRWLSVSLAWVLLAAVLWALALTSLVSWWRTPENALDSRFGAFDIQGIVPIAYAVFAVALGTAVGTFVRRVLPALAVTLGAFVAIRVAVGNYLRPHFMAPLRVLTNIVVIPKGSGTAMISLPGVPQHAWVLDGGLVGPRGQLDAPIPDECKLFLGKGFGVPGQCLAAHGFRQETLYQPASRFWPFQGYESAIFVALALVAIGLTYWWLSRRDA
jgi:hypothetical protein